MCSRFLYLNSLRKRDRFETAIDASSNRRAIF